AGGAAPLGPEGVQRREVGVEVGAAGDLEGAAAVATERVGPGPADQDVPAEAGVEGVVAGAADEDVVGGAPPGVEDVAAVAAEQERRRRDVDQLVVDRPAHLLDDVPAPLGVNDDVAGGAEGALDDPVDLHLDGPVGVVRHQGDQVAAGGAAHDQGRGGGVHG